jgi:flagellar hook-associated protein 1 FlgK
MGSGILGTGVSGLQRRTARVADHRAQHRQRQHPGFHAPADVHSGEQCRACNTGSGFLGQGTHVATIERVYSRFLTEQVDRSQSERSELDSYSRRSSRSTTCWPTAVPACRRHCRVSSMACSRWRPIPSHLPSRQALVSSAQALERSLPVAGHATRADVRRHQRRNQATVTAINSYAEQIALAERAGSASPRRATGHSPTICWIAAITWWPS